MSLFSELKRRNVMRAGISWLALSWLLVAIADLLFPYLGFPDAAIRGLIVGLLLALLPLLVLAWLLELTPNGLRRDRGPGRANPENARAARRLDQLSVVCILAALGLSALREFVLIEEVSPGRPVTVETAAPLLDDEDDTAPAAPADPRSIAVLPFANMSPDAENAYLADGMAEELLNVLSRIDGLKVASRTSSFSFRDEAVAVREIGQRLGVAHIVDGSVRRQGDQVRIAAQLIRATDDRQLWSGSFDRRVADLFSLQEDIAQAITNALIEPLGVREVAVRRATDDPLAYELYLRGRQLFAQRGASLMPARELLRRAVEHDSSFAEAWAVLAAIEYVLPSYFSEVDNLTARLAAADAASKALALIPDEASALAVSARLAADRGERQAALNLVDRSLAVDPNNANTLMWKGLTLLETGQIAAAREVFDRARRLDPLSGIHLGWLASTELVDGRFDRAEAHLDEAHALGWQGPASAWKLKLVLNRDGYGPGAEQAYRRWIQDDGRIEPEAAETYHAVAPAFGKPELAAEAEARILAAAADHPELDWAPLLLNLGRTEAALNELIRPKPPSRQITLMMIWTPVDRPLREHPRFIEFADQVGLMTYWNQHHWPDHCKMAEDTPVRLECDR